MGTVLLRLSPNHFSYSYQVIKTYSNPMFSETMVAAQIRAAVSPYLLLI